MIQHLAARRESQTAAVRHRVARIDGEVHQHLIKLTRIDAHAPDGGIQNKRELDVVTNQTAEHSARFGDDRIQIDHLRLQQRLAAERQQLPRECGGARGGVTDRLDRFLQIGIRIDIRAQYFAVGEDDREKIVEVVCNAAGELTDGFHFERLP